MRHTGTSPARTLDPSLARLIPDRSGYVFTLFDGLGTNLIDSSFPSLAQSQKAILDAPFPTTTSVSLSSIATASTPAEHGVVGLTMDIPDLEIVVNTLTWENYRSKNKLFEIGSLLPAPNLWERLAESGIESVVVSPPKTRNSELSELIYRGCRQIIAETWSDWIDYILALASPGRLVFGYMFPVDYSSHRWGVKSKECMQAVEWVDETWQLLSDRLPDKVGLVGTADHGLINVAPSHKQMVGNLIKSAKIGGDSRCLFVYGELPDRVWDRFGLTPTPIGEVRHWWGPGSHPELDKRLPDYVAYAHEGRAFVMKDKNKTVGFHGGLEPDEMKIPLLVRD